MLYIYTPEILKKEIDAMVEKHGYQFFLLSSSRDGAAYAPSDRKPMYRIPVAVPDVFAPGRMNMPKANIGFYMMGISDASVFDENGQKECDKAIQRRKDETETKET
jgi:hypothetical protein